MLPTWTFCLGVAGFDVQKKGGFMGQLDSYAKVFFEKKENFAALFNGYLFQGSEVLCPEELVDEKTTEVFNGTKRASLFLKRERDLLKALAWKCGKDCSYLLLGLEAQSYHDATMPLRCMMYDAINYTNQLKHAQQGQTKPCGRNSDGVFLGSLSESPRLIPIITLVLALTDSPWQNGRELHDMLALPKEPALRGHISNYRINLITPATMTDAEILFYGRELGAVLLAAKNAGNTKDLLKAMNTHEVFQDLDYDTARLINVMTNLEIHFNNKDKKERIDMTQKTISFKEICLQEGRKEGRKEGLAQGREEGQRRGVIFTLMKMGKAQEEISKWLMETFSLTEQQAKHEISQYQASLAEK
ncbi:MAG: Rpn family recombination-promoting nuclease/putative transposase [Victivallales bacterium]|nr:Rpn family recombination-promoting nuclease/putative transposase [Victivallales bacterium]